MRVIAISHHCHEAEVDQNHIEQTMISSRKSIFSCRIGPVKFLQEYENKGDNFCEMTSASHGAQLNAISYRSPCLIQSHWVLVSDVVQHEWIHMNGK